MNRYVVEFIGAFFLVFTIGLVSIDPGSAGALAPIAIGSVLAVMVYAGGPISGAHYNPAATLGVWLRGKIGPIDAVIYMVVQVLGAIVAAAVVLLVRGSPSTRPASLDTIPAFIGEFLFTFALVYVILNVATSKRSEGNSYFGFAIGFTVLAGAYAVGPISGGAFSPAVAVGTTIMGMSPLSDIWIILAATFLGGAAAAAVFRFVDSDPQSEPAGNS